MARTGVSRGAKRSGVRPVRSSTEPRGHREQLSRARRASEPNLQRRMRRVDEPADESHLDGAAQRSRVPEHTATVQGHRWCRRPSCAAAREVNLVDRAAIGRNPHPAAREHVAATRDRCDNRGWRVRRRRRLRRRRSSLAGRLAVCRLTRSSRLGRLDDGPLRLGRPDLARTRLPGLGRTHGRPIRFDTREGGASPDRFPLERRTVRAHGHSTGLREAGPDRTGRRLPGSQVAFPGRARAGRRPVNRHESQERRHRDDRDEPPAKCMAARQSPAEVTGTHVPRRVSLQSWMRAKNVELPLPSRRRPQARGRTARTGPGRILAHERGKRPVTRSVVVAAPSEVSASPARIGRRPQHRRGSP